MNLGTVREKIQRITSRKSASDDHHVLDAIDSVCRRYHRRKYRFNTKSLQFNTNGQVTDRSPDGNLFSGVDPNIIYYFPWDLLVVIKLARISNEYPTHEIGEMTLDALQTSGPYNHTKTYGTGRFGYRYNEGIPRGFAFEGNDRLHIRPIPDSAYPVEAYYICDIGRPVLTWEEGTWILRDSVTGDKMDDSSEGPWFKEAQDLTIWGAANELFMGIYGDSEKAQRTQVMEARALKDLERFNRMATGPRSARAHYR